MPDLFLPTLGDQIKCVERELAMRARVYARRVSDGKMKQDVADREIATMTAVLVTLKSISEKST